LKKKKINKRIEYSKEAGTKVMSQPLFPNKWRFKSSFFGSGAEKSQNIRNYFWIFLLISRSGRLAQPG
jgi:hypothetical protein